ncbi:MAG TPA: type II secretion system protein [Verrucomicrobiota bacterium]|nr:type II secretion system protein [Verrucomicrobiota bacterium]
MQKTIKRRGFTLIELLVVIAIVGVLASMLLPALGRAKSRAKATHCLSNLKQIGVCSHLYADDHEQSLPRSQHSGQSWVNSLQPYAGGKVLWRCPSDDKTTRPYSYAVNDYLTPPPPGQADYSTIGRIPSTSETMFMTECADKYTFNDHFHFAEHNDGNYSPFNYAQQVATERHLGSANHLFIDGHARALKWKLLQTELSRSGSRLINPAGHH